MALYKVNEGHTWGLDKKPAGSVVELEPADVAGLTPWKLIPLSTNYDLKVNLPPDDKNTLADGGEKVNDSILMGDPDDEDGYEIPWASGLSDRIIDLLEEADVFPENLPTMTDESILAVRRIGPAYLKEIREYYPAE